MTILAGLRLTAQVWYDNTPHQITNGYGAITTNSATTTGELIYLTTGTVTLRNGRAYRITVSTLVNGTQPDTARIFVKRGNASGAALLDTQGVAIPRSGSNGRVSYENVAVNVTGADLTSVLVATIQRFSGTAAAVSVAASTVSPSYVRVEDVGAATDYPGATSIT